MKKKRTMLTPNSYVEDTVEDLTPTIEIGTENISAHYYYDFSGEIEILNDDGEQIFFKDDGKLKHHIEYLDEAIEELQKAYQVNIKIFKKAIALLKKEQIKKLKGK